MNEDNILKSRLKDLADKSYRQNIYTYSGFLNPAELALLEEVKPDINHVDYETCGGYELADRQMVGFGSNRSLGYEGQWPITIIKVEPLIDKFADELTHRDFLGAVMNLGIERSVFGDILVKDGKRAYIFAMDSIAEYIMDNLTKIKHTNVRTSVVEPDFDDMEDLKPVLVDMELIVASPRFDAIVGAVSKLSRSESLNLFKAAKITLNGRMCQRNSLSLKEGDIFSVRGYGKYRYVGCGAQTKKGRVYVKLQRYT